MLSGTIHRWKGNQNKPLIVCLHGFLGTGEDFEIVADHYNNHPTLLAPNFPDHLIPPERSDHPWEETLESLNQLIHKESPDKPCILLGYSMGGRIALQFAMKYQHLLKGLILVGATPGLQNEDERIERVRKDERLAAKLLEEGLESFLEFWFNQELIKSQGQIKEPYKSKMQKTRYANNVNAIAYSLTALGTGTMNPAWDQLNQLTLPTLIMTGAEDPKFCAIAENMMNRLPNGSYSSVANAGHSACFESPEDFSALIETFLQDLGRT